MHVTLKDIKEIQPIQNVVYIVKMKQKLGWETEIAPHTWIIFPVHSIKKNKIKQNPETLGIHYNGK